MYGAWTEIRRSKLDHQTSFISSIGGTSVSSSPGGNNTPLGETSARHPYGRIPEEVVTSPVIAAANVADSIRLSKSSSKGGEDIENLF